MKIFDNNSTIQNNRKYLFEGTHPKLHSDHYRGYMDNNYVLGRPLIGIIILASLFLCTLIGALMVILIFCKKKNTIFVLPKSSLSEAWRSSIEMNSFHSGSVPDLNGYGDWLMLYNGKLHSVFPSGNFNSNAIAKNTQPMSVESAFLLHLFGSNRSLSNNNKLRDLSSDLNISRSQSCHSNFSFKLPSFSLLKRSVSKRGLKLSLSKTYERLNDPEDSDPISNNQSTSKTYTLLNCDHIPMEESNDVYGCAISSRPWLKDTQTQISLIETDYSKIKVNINRKIYGIRNVYLSNN